VQLLALQFEKVQQELKNQAYRLGQELKVRDENHQTERKNFAGRLHEVEEKKNSVLAHELELLSLTEFTDMAIWQERQKVFQEALKACKSTQKDLEVTRAQVQSLMQLEHNRADLDKQWKLLKQLSKKNKHDFVFRVKRLRAEGEALGLSQAVEDSVEMDAERTQTCRVPLSSDRVLETI
jgi:hypothetical protein